MTRGALGFPEEQRFTFSRIEAGRRRRRERISGSETADEGNELPRLFVADAGERRHLRSGHTGANRVEQITVLVAVREVPTVQRGTAIALPFRTMARLARLVVHATPCGNRVGIPGE